MHVLYTSLQMYHINLEISGKNIYHTHTHTHLHHLTFRNFFHPSFRQLYICEKKSLKLYIDCSKKKWVHVCVNYNLTFILLTYLPVECAVATSKYCFKCKIRSNIIRTSSNLKRKNNNNNINHKRKWIQVLVPREFSRQKLNERCNIYHRLSINVQHLERDDKSKIWKTHTHTK